MKPTLRLILLFLAVLALALTACGTDNDPDQNHHHFDPDQIAIDFEADFLTVYLVSGPSFLRACLVSFPSSQNLR